MTTLDLAQIVIRRGTASQWSVADPILASGEFGLETDTALVKIGDGTSLWSVLTYQGPQLAAQINSATAKATPVGADTFPLSDSAASNGLKKVSWTNILATAKAYFDTLYATIASLASYATTASLSAYATLASPTFTGTVSIPAGVVGTAANAGYMGIPQNATTTGSYTITAADNGKTIYCTATRTLTIDSNANLALPKGFTFAVVAASGATVTIAITTDTMNLSPAGTTGSRTLAPYGVAAFQKLDTTLWIASGSGLT